MDESLQTIRFTLQSGLEVADHINGGWIAKYANAMGESLNMRMRWVNR